MRDSQTDPFVVHAKTRPIRMSRRELLYGSTGAAVVAASGTLLGPGAYRAQGESQRVPAMRSPDNFAHVMAAGAPALPALEVLTLNRMAFGPRPGDLQAMRDLGDTDSARLEAYVDQQLEPSTIDDSECEARLSAQGFATLGKSRAQLWQDHVVAEGVTWEERTRPVREVRDATFIRAVYSKRQLVEILADFWHNHFNVYGWDYWTAPVWVHYDRDVIRNNLLGNFRQMLEDVAQSPAMLYYLDNQSNSGGNPNENYARELFELHTMGAENYLGVVPLEVGDGGGFIHPAPVDEDGRPLLFVDADVYGATTCFTGWRVDHETGNFAFDANAHFPYQKFVLGVAIPDSQGVQDGHDVLDLLAEHPGTARYVCRKLCRRLIGDVPPDSVVEQAAQLFLDKKDDADQLKAVIRTILLSDEFRTTWGQKVKRPFEYVVSALRATGADWEANDSFYWRYENMGQALFRWHPPNGYPDLQEDWTSTMPMLQRWRTINWLLQWNYEGSDVPRVAFVNPDWAKNATQIVDYWSAVILGRLLPDNERTSVIEFMAQGRHPETDLSATQIEESLRHMIGLILMSPSFQWR